MRLTDDELTSLDSIQYPTAPTGTYSLGGSGLDNLITGGSYDPSYDDGLGHYWDSAIQGWRNKSDGSVYSPNQGYDYSADPGLGVYGDQGSYQPPNYSLGFGGSPVTSYTNPDANGDGLNDANGWAVGVIQDYASPTGFSYNGQPTYSNGSPYVENTYQQPGGDWYNYDQYKDSGTGWDTYNLNNPGLSSPDLNYQTPEDAITALRRRGQYVPNDISRADLAARVAALGTPIGDGSFGQGLKDFAGATGTAAGDIISAPQKYVGGPLAQAAWDNPGTAISTALNPMAGLQNLGIQSLLNPGGAQDKYQQYYDANQEVLNNPDTNPFLREGYRTLTDPLTYLGPTAAAKLIPGEGTTANVIRSLVDQGGIEAVLGGNLGAVAANTETAQNIPYFGDQPAWLRGIEGGAIGGLGAAGFAGTLKATAENAGEGGLKRALGQAGEATTPGPDEALNPIRRKVADALDEELKWRNSGEAEAIKATKRAEQAAGLNAVEAGATSAETLANVSAGARVGKFFDNTPGLKLSETDYNAALTDLVNSTEGFDKIQAVKALDKLQNGERLQPAEIKTLGKLYGPEIEAKIRATNADRVSSIAELTDADKAQIARQAEVDGRRVATLEVQAKRQHELADNLNQRSLMNPTNKQLKTAAEAARARAIKAENDADRILAERAAAVEAKQNTKAFNAAQNAAKKESTKALRSDLTRDFTESGQKAMADAEKAIDKLDVSPAMKQAQKDTVAIWLKQNERILDTLGEDGPGLLRRAYAAYTGEVTDSWTSALISRRRALETALESQGMSGEAARVIGKFVQDAEVKRRFGAEVPIWVTDSLDQSKGIVRNDAGKAIRPREANIISAAADYSQEFKNTAFGIGDVAAFGQNGIHILNTNAVQFIAGLTNRLANMANIGFDTRAIGEDLIGKRAANALDSLSHSGATGIVDTSNGTLLRHIPGLSAVDRKLLTPAINTLTDIQFKHVLGWMRDVNFEGNLVLAKMAGADITDPAVRMRAAEWANAASGAGKLAQRANRANLEKASILSASMTRAQGQQLGQVARGLTAGSRVDRVLAAATIVSTVGTTLAIGKLLNDWVGTEEFNFDPFSKPKPGQLRFGDIRLGDGTTINLFSQTQVPKVLAQSIGVLAQDGFTKDDLSALGKAWGNFGMGRSSPALRLGEAAVGLGYEPSRGYRYGDYMEGKSLTDKILSQLPIPPVVSQTFLQGERGKVLTPANIAGVNAFPESDYSQRDRKAIDEYGKPYGQLSESEKFAFDQKNGKVLSSDPKIRQQQEQSAALIQQQTDRQNARDAQLQQNGMTPDNWRLWRDQRKQDNLYFAGRFDQLYQGVNFNDKNITDVDRYYKAIADNTDRVTGDVNWDAVDQATKGLDQAYIKANTNLRDTDTERVYHDAVNQIAATGYFDREKQAWQKVVEQLPQWSSTDLTVNPQDYPSYDAWRTAALNQALASVGKTPSDVGEVTKINSWLDKQSPTKGVDYFTAQWKDAWVEANPREAYLAWQMGYYNPKKEIKDWLAKQFE